MGLFSSKKKTTVGTSVSRVIDNALLPSAVKTGVIKAIFEEGDVVDYVMEEMISSVGVRAERMYAYAKTKYSYGLPSGNLVSSVTGQSIVEGVIAVTAGQPIVTEYYHFGPLNALHFGWLTLVDTYGYAQASNEITVLSAVKGYPVFLKDMVVVVSDATLAELENGSLAQWGTAPNAGVTPQRTAQSAAIGSLRTPSPFVVDPNASQDFVRVDYVWEQPVQVMVSGVSVTRKEIKEESLVIPVAASGLDEEDDCFQVKYSYGDQVKYWLYKAGAGTYPEVDAIFSTEYAGLGSFFPFAYFRFNKTSMAADTGSQEYKTSKKLVKYLGMDYATVIDAIHENPGIADIEQAMLVMAVPAVTTDPMEQRYLFDFFDDVYFKAGGIGSTPGGKPKSVTQYGIFNGLGNTPDDTSIVIQDARFKMALSFKGIFKKRKAGVLGTGGLLFSGQSNEAVTQTGVDATTQLPVTWTTQIPVHYYRQQVSDTLYDEVQVFGLKMTYHIYGKYSAVGDESDTILLIPIDRSISSKYSIPDREVLYSRSLHYVFNSRIVTKVKWYQTGVFQIFMIIVSIVLTIVTLGAYGPAAAAYLAAIAAGTVTLSAVLIGILLTYILPFLATLIAAKLFIKYAGAKVALIVAIVIAVYAGYTAFETGSLSGAPWAQELLKMSTSLTSEIGNAIQGDILDLMKDAKKFGESAKERIALLDQANDLLNGNNLLTPFTIFGEKPDDYYNRTVHSGNIGVLGIDALSAFVDISLTLPKLTDTMEN